MKQPRFLLMPPRILWLLLATSSALHWALGLAITVVQSTPAGVALIAFGIGINLWASRIFERERTPIRPDETPTSIVERGPFRWSRNPMYVGLVALHLGVALITGGVAFWISACLYAAILRVFFIPHEERVLHEAFGEAYANYASRVFRWLGLRPTSIRRQDRQQGQGATTSCP